MSLFIVPRRSSRARSASIKYVSAASKLQGALYITSIQNANILQHTTPERKKKYITSWCELVFDAVQNDGIESSEALNTLNL